MIPAIKKELLEGRPRFSIDSDPIKLKGFKEQNSYLNKLSPSNQRWKICRIFDHVLKCILSYFTIVRPDVMKSKLPWIIRSGSASASGPVKVTFGELWSHYKKFLLADRQCNPRLKACFSRLESDEEKILKMAAKKAKENPPKTNTGTDKPSDQVEESKPTEEQKKFCEKSYQELLKMKEGDVRLFGLQKESLFLVVVKQGQKHTLRFVGQGSVMSQFDKTSMPVAGKEKVIRELCFEEVDLLKEENKKMMNELLGLWSEGKNVDPKTVLEKTSHLSKKEIGSLNDLTSRSDRVDRLFWHTIQACNEVKIKQTPSPSDKTIESKRIRLRADVCTLYDHFQKMRYSLKPHTSDYQILTELFQAVSQRVYLAKEKGYLSDEESKELKQQLGIIEKALQEAKKVPVSLPVKIDMAKETLKGVFFKDLPVGKMGQIPDSTRIEKKHRSDGVLPSKIPNEIHQVSKISQPLYDKISDKEAFLKTFRNLYDQAIEKSPQSENALALQEIERFFNELPYDYQEVKNPEYFWRKFTEQERKEITDKINKITHLIVDSKQRSEISQYEFEAILKMTQWIALLHAFSTGDWIVDWNASRLLESYIQENQFSTRTNFRLQPNLPNPDVGSIYEYSEAKVMKELFKFLVYDGTRGDSFVFKSEKEYATKEILIPIESMKTYHDQLKMVGLMLHVQHHFYFYMNHDSFFEDVQFEKWLRPISNPHLKALYRSYIAEPFLKDDSHRNHLRDGLTSPEAFYDNPKGIFEYFLNKSQETNIAQIDQIFSDDELKKLLHLMRHRKPHSELIALMHQSPHLLLNSDVRNIFDSLFFRGDLKGDIKKKYREVNIRGFVDQIEEETNRLEALINESLKQTLVQDPKLLQSRMEALLYHYELKLKLQELIYEIKGSKYASPERSIAQLLKLCEERNELQPCLGYAARVHLRSLFYQEAPDMPSILKNYALVHGTNTHLGNIDPYFEEELKRNWHHIIRESSKSSLQLNNFFDQLCYLNDLPLDGSEWKKSEGSIYSNSVYQINLKTLEISNLGSSSVIEQLPEILRDYFSEGIGPNIEDWRVEKYSDHEKTIYSLKDSLDRPIQIEKKKDQCSLYKKFKIEDKEKWLQYLSREYLTSKPSKEEETPSAFKMFKELMGDSKLSEPAISALFNHGLFIDPERPTDLYCLDADEQIAFKVEMKESKDGLTFGEVTDFRSLPSIKAQCVNASKIENETFDLLASFENKENMILWVEKGRIKRVEMIRYGLTFAYENGRLVCENPALKGYFIQLNASLSEKKGLPYSLLLEHSDSTKSKKLLVVESRAIVAKEKVRHPEARGLGKVRLFLEEIKTLFDAFFFQKAPKTQIEEYFGIDASLKQLQYSIWDLRPHTGEICRVDQAKAEDLLELIKQALIIQQPGLAYEIAKKLLNPEKLDTKFLNHLIKFLNTKVVGGGAEAALKIKLGFEIKKSLKQQKKLNTEVKASLNRCIMNRSKEFFEHGRKIPAELQLTVSELTKIGRLFQKKEATYFETHLSAYFLPNGQSLDLLDIPAANDAFEKHHDAFKEQRSPLDLETRIKNLEDKIDPSNRLKDKLSYSIEKNEQGDPLLQTTEKDLQGLFETKKTSLNHLQFNSDLAKSTCEKQAIIDYQESVDAYKTEEDQRETYKIIVDKKKLKKFGEAKILPQKISFEEKVVSARSRIESMVRISTQDKEQFAIYAGALSIASFDELRIAFAKGRLEDLQNSKRLPSTLDLAELKKELVHYFDASSRRNAAMAVLKMIDDIVTLGDPTNQEEWESMSQALHRLLTIRRHYNPHQDGRLLIFEAQQFINLKLLDGGLDQLQLLKDFVNDPFSITQAPTGAGKTAVLSSMGTELRANGKNLVIQKVLPALLKQTYKQFRETLFDLNGTPIYLLAFNLKMPLTEKRVVKVLNDQGKLEEKKEEHSIFMDMYFNFLKIIEGEGCLLTDYKSLPLLEEMFFKVGQTLCERDIQGLEPDVVLKEHFTYLRKILLLLENKGIESMDEFDQPNRPIQKIQLDLGVGSNPLPQFMIETSLDIYDLLAKNEPLGLLKDIQGDLSPATRQEILNEVADQMASILAKNASDDSLKDSIKEYLLGKNEDVLPSIADLSPLLKDKITLCKDQFSIFLPLTLSYKGSSRYKRSEEGAKTLPCMDGDPHDAKFGTILEQINYTIQDYLQNGITIYDLKPWIIDLKQRTDEMPDGSEKDRLISEFNKMLPGYTLIGAVELLHHKKGIDKLLKEVNQDREKILQFLKNKLRELKTSGVVIPMDPQNIIDMNRAVSGISATMGAPESLHRHFNVDHKRNGQIQAGMVYRLEKRKRQESIIQYDPVNPEEVLKMANEKVHAIIDGAGAFKNVKAGAEALLKSNPSLKQVGYHAEDGTIAFVGAQTSKLNETGFFFCQSQTRGTDITLPPDAKAILTVSEKDGISKVFQKEGRLRQPRQRYLLAISKYQGIQTVAEEESHAIAQEAIFNAQDIFRKCKQEPKAILRHGIKQMLLKAETPKEFVTLFSRDAVRAYFINKPESHYEVSGSYFEKHQHLQKEDQLPETVLMNLKNEMIIQAENLGLSETVAELEKIQYSTELLAKMPSNVAPYGANQGELEMELQVEQEEETEQESEVELETTNEVEHAQAKGPLGTYPMRVHSSLTHSVSETIHNAYDPLIHMTDAFMPFSRKQTNSFHKRRPFDSLMYRIGQVYMDVNWENGKVLRLIVEDPLDDFQISIHHDVHYDIRTDKFTQHSKINAKDPEFIKLIAQVKFLDGRTSGYLEPELQALERWLQANDPQKMKSHLLDQILQHRHKDKLAFQGSQLEKLFEKL